MDEQTQTSCAPSCIVEMPNSPLVTPCSHGSAMGKSWAVGSHWRGWQTAQLSLTTSPTPPGVAATQPSLLAPGRAAGDVPGALGPSVHGEAVSPDDAGMCHLHHKPASSSHGSHLLPSLVTASWSCPPYLMRKPRSSFPKESSQKASRRARSTCVTPHSRSERDGSAHPSCRAAGLLALGAFPVPSSCLPDTVRSAASYRHTDGASQY